MCHIQSCGLKHSLYTNASQIRTSSLSLPPELSIQKCDCPRHFCSWLSNNQHAPDGTFYFMSPQTCSSPPLPPFCNAVSFHPPVQANDPGVSNPLPSHSTPTPSACLPVLPAEHTQNLIAPHVSPHTLFPPVLPGTHGSLRRNHVFSKRQQIYTI